MTWEGTPWPQHSEPQGLGTFLCVLEADRLQHIATAPVGAFRDSAHMLACALELYMLKAFGQWLPKLRFSAMSRAFGSLSQIAGLMLVWGPSHQHSNHEQLSA